MAGGGDGGGAGGGGDGGGGDGGGGDGPLRTTRLSVGAVAAMTV